MGTSVRYKNLVYFFDGVHIEHGHQHEAANRLDPRKFFLKRNLPEPILNLPFGSHFFVEFVLKIKQIYPHVDKIRPVRPDGEMGDFQRNLVYNSLICSFGSLFCQIGALERSAPDVFAGQHCQDFVGERGFSGSQRVGSPYSAGRTRPTVCFGHSHVYQYRQWADDMEYFNTGTWTDITSLDIASLGKITKLSYVLFEYPEDGGRPRGRLKEWHGYHRIEEDVAIA